MRLDLYLFSVGLAKSRSYAQSLISFGYVLVNGITAQKPSFQIDPETDKVDVTGQLYEYVSRGGVKLEAALNRFGVDPAGMNCIDIGASTGGFTHCLLKHGAKKVTAVDIGHGQLAAELREDSRVVNREGLNARNLTLEDIGYESALAVSDISFISQTYVIPVLPPLLSERGTYIALVKPQFECGRSGLGKNGIVKDNKVRLEALSKVIACASENSLGAVGVEKSPITGGDGNEEYLICCVKGARQTVTEDRIREVCGI